MNTLNTFTKAALCMLVVLLSVDASSQTVRAVSKAPSAQAPARKSSYTISGVVKDKDGLTMEYCDVILRSTSDSTFVRGTVSNAEGKFKITIPEGDYKLSISMIGYGAYVKKFKLDKNTDMGIVNLSVDPKMLSEMVVTSRLIEREADKFVMNNVGASPISIGKSSLEILNFAPGVFVDNDGKITMNGRTGTRIMINDRFKNMDAEQLAAFLKNIKAEDILKVEIIPNPGAEYESSSSGGIIHYTIKKSALQGINGSLGLNVRTNDYVSPGVNGRIEYGKGKVSFYGRVGYNKGQYAHNSRSESVFISQNNRRDSENFGKGDNNSTYGNIGMMYEINKNQSIGVEADLSSFGSSSRSNSNMYMNEGAIKKHVPTKNLSNNQYSYNTISANYKLQTDTLGSTFKVMVDWTQRKSDWGSEYDSRYMLFNPATGEYDQLERDNIYNQGRDSDNQMFTFSSDYKHMFTKKTILRVGARYNRLQVEDHSDYAKFQNNDWQVDPNRQDFYKYTEDLGAAFTTFSFSVKNFNYTIGLRLETYRMAGYSVTLDKEYVYSGTNIFPNMYVSYNFNKKKGHSAGLSYNYRINRPYYSQLNPNVIQNGDFDITVGRPDIRPSFTHNFNLNTTIKYKYNFFFGYSNRNGSYGYVTKANPDPDKPNSTINTYEEKKQDNNFSLGANFRENVAKWWMINTNLNVGYNTYKILDMHRESFDGYAFVSNQFTLPKNWNASFDGQAYNFSGGGNSSSSFNWQLSAGFSKRLLKNKNLLLSLRVNDLLNTGGKYTYRSETNDFYQYSQSERMSRSFYLSATWSFSKGLKLKGNKVESGNSEDRGRL